MTSEYVNGPSKGEAAIDPAQVQHLHAEGWGRNGIARHLGVTTYRVDKIAADLGLGWDRARTRKAVEARVAEAELERERLAADFRAVAQSILSTVLGARDLDADTLKSLMWTAGSAAASDARYGRLALDRQANPRLQDLDGSGVQAVVEAMAASWALLEEEDEEELVAQVEESDRRFRNGADQFDGAGEPEDN